jgi:hypothetical protein
MSKRLDVLLAVKALVQGALPGADVLGLDGSDAAPDRVAPGGRVIVRSGDPGEPEMDLSPPSYHYEHAIPLELVAYQSGSLTNEEAIDLMLGQIAAAIEADRFLGGLVDYLEATAPLTDDDYSEAAAVPRRADATITATYSTTHPL